MCDPLGPNAKDRQDDVRKFFIAAPDMTVHVCTILDKLPKKDKQDVSVVMDARTMAQMLFGRAYPAKKNSCPAEVMTARTEHRLFANSRY